MRIVKQSMFGASRWRVIGGPVFSDEIDASDYVEETMSDYRANIVGEQKYDAAFMTLCGMRW